MTTDTMGVQNSKVDWNNRGSSPSQVTQAADAAAPSAAAPMGQNEVYASASGMGTSSQGLPPSCNKAAAASPGDLLPKDANNEWARLNPSGGADFENNGNVGTWFEF